MPKPKPKPPSHPHPRYRGVTRSEPYPSASGANKTRTGGGGNNHGGHNDSESGSGSTGRMYHPAVSSESSTAGVIPGVSATPAQPGQQQSSAPQTFVGHGLNTAIGVGAGFGAGVSGMVDIQYGEGLGLFAATRMTMTMTSTTPRTIPRSGDYGHRSSSSEEEFGKGQSFGVALQGGNQQNGSPTLAQEFQLGGGGYQHQHHQPVQHHSLQGQQPQHQSSTIVNHNAAYSQGQPNQYRPHSLQTQPQQPSQQQQLQSHQQTPFQPRSDNPDVESPTYKPHPRSPGHNPTTPWTASEDSLLLSLRGSSSSSSSRPNPNYPNPTHPTSSSSSHHTSSLSSHPGPMPWSLLQTYFPSKSANACRKRYERLIEKQQAEEKLDEERMVRIATEYIKMREQLWGELARRVGMSVKEVEGWCMRRGVGGLKVAGRRGGRRGLRERGRGGFGERGVVTGLGSGGGGMPMMLGQSQNLGQQRNGHGVGVGAVGMAVDMDGETGEEAKNYTTSPLQVGSNGTGRPPTVSGSGTAPGNVGPVAGVGPMTAGQGQAPGQVQAALNLLPSAMPPLTTQVPISATTSTGPASASPGLKLAPQMPLLPLTISPPGMMMMSRQHQPKVAFGGYLNGRSTATSTRQASQSLSAPSTSMSTSPTAPPPTTGSTMGNGGGGGGYHQLLQGQSVQGQQWRQQGRADLAPGVVAGGSFQHHQNQQPMIPGQARQGRRWYTTNNVGYPPSSFG